MWFNEKFETFWLEIKNTNVIFWNCRGCFLKNWNRTSKEVSAHYGLNPWEPEVKKLWYSYYLPVFPSFCGGLLKKCFRSRSFSGTTMKKWFKIAISVQERTSRYIISEKLLLSYLLDFLKREFQNKNVCLFSFVSILADCLLSPLFVHQLKNGSFFAKNVN